ncbi:MAG: histidine phosphatase family protein [Clostridiales bacterium]|nr:histidine phosphatase family protein [Clostridiales bacterium]
MRSYTVYLIRHGMNEGATDGRYIGHTDVSLLSQGKEELFELKNKYVYPPVSAVFSSPLKRCLESAKILYPDNEPLVLDDLIECNFGSWENKTALELKGNDLFARWLAGEKGVCPPFGESGTDFVKRVCAIFEKLTEGLMKTGTFETAVITHQGVMGIILACYGLPSRPMHWWITGNGNGFTLKINPILWSHQKKFEIFSKFPYEREDTD